MGNTKIIIPKISNFKKPNNATRKVASIVTAPQGYEGEGFPVRRAFAGIPHNILDPFIHMDQMGEVNYAPGEPKGTPWHPHRGFETFTYLISGEFVHQDSTGGGGIIRPGGTQYMTAGSGLLHIETPPEQLVMAGGVFHGIQLWINLPSSKKMIAPQYQDLQSSETIILTDDQQQITVRLLAGSFDGTNFGPGISHTPLAITHITVPADVQTIIPWPANFNALAYILSGEGYVGKEKHPIHMGQTAIFTTGDSITLGTKKNRPQTSSGMEIFLIGGKPLKEPVQSYGPFVMNTRTEILQAIDDYQKGKFGLIPPQAIQPYKP